MSLLIAAAATSTPTTPEDGVSIHDPTPATLDWSTARTIVLCTHIPGAVSLREQDDIIHDPADPSAPWKFYFTAAFSATPDDDSRTYLITSTDRNTWSAPIPCTIAGGGTLVGQDPAVTQTYNQGPPIAYRDGSGRLWMFLERNAPYSYVSVYHSTDGVVWTLGVSPAIARGSAGQWDEALTGSPVARHDGTSFIVGYEGISGLVESSGLAIGPDPTALVKHAANPVLTAAALGAVGSTVFWDAFWVTPDGERVIITGHPGYASGQTMFRATTTNLDPTTWTTADFTYLGVAGAGREDLTADLAGALLVTAPSDDQSMVAVRLLA